MRMGLLECREVGVRRLNLPNASFEGTPTVRVELNTRLQEVRETFTVGDVDEPLVLPAGPYLRAAITGADLVLGQIGSEDSLGELSGNFFLESRDGVVILAATGVGAAVTVNEDSGAGFTGGSGGLIVSDAGMAGSFKGELAAAVGGLDAETTLILRFNNTGSAVEEAIEVGSEKIRISFSSSEGNLFSVSLIGAVLNIGDFATLEGSFTFQTQGDYEVLGGSGLTLFVERGRLGSKMVKSIHLLGAPVTNATVGLVRSGEGGPMALEATVSPELDSAAPPWRGPPGFGLILSRVRFPRRSALRE